MRSDRQGLIVLLHQTRCQSARTTFVGSTDSNSLCTCLFRARMQILSCDFHAPSSIFAGIRHEPEVMAPHCGRKDVVWCLMYVRPLVTGSFPSTPVKAGVINGHTPTRASHHLRGPWTFSYMLLQVRSRKIRTVIEH